MAENATSAVWYYAYRGRPRGPFDPIAFHTLIRNGVLAPDTLVWQPGWEDWQPLHRALPDAEWPKAAELPSGARCAECGRPADAERLVRLGGHPICTHCRDLVVQRLKETGVVLEPMPLASILPRFLASLLDNFLVALVLYPLATVFTFWLLPELDPEKWNPQQVFRMYLAQSGISIFGLILSGVYEIWTVGRFGGTLGKLAFRMRVTDPEGRRITYGRATGRFLAKILSQLTCGLGYLLALFDRDRRALHDMICNTRVIRT